MWAAVINILSVEKSTQTFAKISNQDAKVWAILLLLRRKRSKEVFVTSWLSTVSTWLNLGDKRGSQPCGSEKKKKRTQESSVLSSWVSPATDSRCTAAPTWRRFLMMEILLLQTKPVGECYDHRQGAAPAGKWVFTNNAVTGGQLFRHWRMMEIITTLLPLPHFC